VRYVVAILLIAAAGTASGAEREGPGRVPSVDEVIANHVEARGGADAIAALRTVVYSNGRYREPVWEGSGNAFMALARPYYKVVGNPETAGSDLGGFMEGYDGAAWEWFGDPGISIRTVGEAAAASRHGAYVDGLLIDYQAKGSTAELGEIVPIGDRRAWRVTVTARDGFRVDYFLDTETWLVIAERMAAPIHAYGEPVRREMRIGDYRRIGGVLFPHRFSETDIATGEMVSEMQWGSIEVNRELPRWWFSPPPYAGREAPLTPLQELLGHLYAERTDPNAILWTYGEFRRVHPEIDTRAGVELIGYQMLKMGDVESAVRLLEANAADYPLAAESAFGLGRAYAAAGEVEAARRAYERALTLDPEHERARRALDDLE
jgi:hypothetical protein